MIRWWGKRKSFDSARATFSLQPALIGPTLFPHQRTILKHGTGGGGRIPCVRGSGWRSPEPPIDHALTIASRLLFARPPVDSEITERRSVLGKPALLGEGAYDGWNISIRNPAHLSLNQEWLLCAFRCGQMPPNNAAKALQMQTVLTGWKEIAQYVRCGVRTVQRWEDEFGFPVHRASNGAHHTVLALPSEINVWVQSQNSAKKFSELKACQIEVVRLKRELAQCQKRAAR